MGKLNENTIIFNKSENEYAKSIFEGMNLKIRQYQYVSYQSLNNNEERKN